jgi:flagellar biogenesis protein FliO
MTTRTIRRAHPKSPAVMKHADHARLWGMVEGGFVIVLAFVMALVWAVVFALLIWRMW